MTRAVPPVRLLVAEDNDDDILLLRESFAVAGITASLHIARDGEEVLRYLRRVGENTLPALIVLDINMPKMNGFEALRALRADPTWRKIPVIMLTTSARSEDADRAHREGACAYIVKPARYDQCGELVNIFKVYCEDAVSSK